MAHFMIFSAFDPFLTSASLITSLDSRYSRSFRFPSQFRLHDFVAQINMWQLMF
uniref:Uncharacterized protein n=1 Tax=Arundo donax TaxID=35708 RepID=A0A0A9A0P7_ARUDO